MSLRKTMCFLMLCLAACQLSCSLLPTEETSVYCYILEHAWWAQGSYRGKALVIIADKTVSHLVAIPEMLDASTSPEADLRAKFPTAGEDTIQDYLRKNLSSTAIARLPGCQIKYKLEKADVVNYYFDKASTHEEYEAYLGEYSDSSYSFFQRFSRVGFNRTKTEAIVYADERRDILAGGGGLGLLRKVHGKWQFVSVAYRWLS